MRVCASAYAAQSLTVEVRHGVAVNVLTTAYSEAYVVPHPWQHIGVVTGAGHGHARVVPGTEVKLWARVENKGAGARHQGCNQYVSQTQARGIGAGYAPIVQEPNTHACEHTHSRTHTRVPQSVLPTHTHERQTLSFPSLDCHELTYSA